MQYLAVCCITLGTRYAIKGGLDESIAYNLSDTYIQQIDKLTSPDKILYFLAEKTIELAKKVSKSKKLIKYPAPIIKTIQYINKNLHNKIAIKDLAKFCNLSPDYLSSLFKKSTGLNLSSYIMKQKLEASKALLIKDYDYSTIGYYFSFCSESHYINRFKKEFGMTPLQFMKKQ